MLWRETVLEPIQEHGFALCSRNTSAPTQQHLTKTLFSANFNATKQPLSMNKPGHHPQPNRLSLSAPSASGPNHALQSP